MDQRKKIATTSQEIQNFKTIRVHRPLSFSFDLHPLVVAGTLQKNIINKILNLPNNCLSNDETYVLKYRTGSMGSEMRQLKTNELIAPLVRASGCLEFFA